MPRPNPVFFIEIATPACRNTCLRETHLDKPLGLLAPPKTKHFGVQARTFQVLAMTDGEKGFIS